jgi:hypothetical protein
VQQAAGQHRHSRATPRSSRRSPSLLLCLLLSPSLRSLVTGHAAVRLHRENMEALLLLLLPPCRCRCHSILLLGLQTLLPCATLRLLNSALLPGAVGLSAAAPSHAPAIFVNHWNYPVCVCVCVTRTHVSVRVCVINRSRYNFCAFEKHVCHHRDVGDHDSFGAELTSWHLAGTFLPGTF